MKRFDKIETEMMKIVLKSEIGNEFMETENKTL